MRVFPVTQIRHLDEARVGLPGESLAVTVSCACRQVIADRIVVLRNTVERGDSQFKARLSIELSSTVLQLRQHGVILIRTGHDGDGFEILSSRAHHGRTAYINVFDGFFQTAIQVAGNRFERIQVDHGHIDPRDILLIHHRIIITLPSKEAAVYSWMQGLDATAHDFRGSRVIRDLGYG